MRSTGDRWGFRSAAVVVLAASLGAGCTRTEEPETAGGNAVTQTGARVPSDAWVTTSVQARYYANEAVRARDIDVTTERGIVTLRGTVPDEAARQQALNLARGVEGVVRVEDQLTIGADAPAQGTPEDAAPRATAADAGTAPRTGAADEQPTATSGEAAATRVEPAWITTKIHAQYFVSPEIKPWNIDVTTTADGVVTLRGEVDSQQDKAEAVRIARATEGVARVEDHLRVKGDPAAATAADQEHGPNQPDTWITAKVQSKYFLDEGLKAHAIDVTTREGVVTLKGQVESEAQRRHAVALARNTDGVRSVTDDLAIRAAADRPAQTLPRVPAVRTLEQAATDALITTTIQSQYFLDDVVKGHRIDVDTRKGVVTLSGTVDREAAKAQAERIARDTAGVARVVSKLEVGSGA